MTEQQSNDKNPSIVPEKRRGFSVAPSPYNPVKLEWGVAVILGLLLIMVAERISPSGGAQLALILGYGGFVGGWLVWRIRRIQARQRGGDGQE